MPIEPQADLFSLRISRPSRTGRSWSWGSADRFKARLVVEKDGDFYVCEGRATGRPGAAYRLAWRLPYGYFGAREGLTKRLGETRRRKYLARVELELLDGAFDGEYLIELRNAPAPRIPFRSSVAFDAVTSAQEVAGDGVLSLSHTAGGADRGAFVGVGASGNAGITSSTTYGGTALTELWDAMFSTFYLHAGYHWPGGSTLPTGAQTVTNTLVGAAVDEHALGVISMTGVDQTTPVGTAVTTTNAAASSISVTVGSVGADDLLADNLFVDANGNNIWSVGADQTERWVQAFATNARQSRGSTQLGSAGGVMSWSAGATSSAVALGAVAFKPTAAAEPSPTTKLFVSSRRRT